MESKSDPLLLAIPLTACFQPLPVPILIFVITSSIFRERDFSTSVKL